MGIQQTCVSSVAPSVPWVPWALAPTPVAPTWRQEGGSGDAQAVGSTD